MKLLRLQLENFRQHAATEVNFQDGMTAIVGANGSGKSTLLEAITFALYGEQRSVQDSIRFYWADSKKISVTLRFALDEQTFEVVRSSDQATLKEIKSQNVVLATGKREVTRACESLLGLKYEHFINSYCAEQKGLAFLQFKDNSVRQREVGRMLGLDRLEKAEALAGEHRKTARTARETLAASLGEEAPLKESVRVAQESERERREEIRISSAKVEELSRLVPQLLEAKKQADRYRALSVEIASIREKADGLKAAAKQAEEEVKAAQLALETYHRLSPSAAQFKVTEAELQKLDAARIQHDRRVTALKQLEEMDTRAEKLRTEVAILDRALSGDANADYQAVTATLQTAEAELKSVTNAHQLAVSEAKERLASITAQLRSEQAELMLAEKWLAAGNCPECGQPFSSDFKSGIEGRRERVRALTAQLEDSKAQVAQLQPVPTTVSEAQVIVETTKQQVEGALKARTEWQRKDAERTQTQKQLAQLEADRQAVKLVADSNAGAFDENRYVATRKLLEELRPLRDQFLAVADAENRLKARQVAHEAKQKTLDEAKARFAALRDERTQLGFESPEAAEAAVATWQAQDRELGVARAGLEHSNRALEQALRLRAEAENRWRLFQERVTQVRELGHREALFEEAARQFRALRAELNRSLRPDLEARASENLSLLTAGRYVSLELDEQFQATLRDDDTRKTVISGGEEDVVALALRLALSELIQERNGRPLSLLVLDEVFGSLDADRRQSVLDRLASLKGRFQQILVISHIEEINQVADQCLYVSRDPQSRATKVTDSVPLVDVL